MEDLTRMVADSLARHGFAAALDHRRLEWSRWFRCESSFSLLLVPSAAGLYALGEEVIAPGELPSASGKRLLAVFQVSETEDLCVALSRLFAPRNPLSARLSSGHCFVRFTLVADSHQRRTACESLSRWLSTTAETVAATDVGLGTMGAYQPASRTPVRDEKLSTLCHPERREAAPNGVEGSHVRPEHSAPEPPFSPLEVGHMAGTAEPQAASHVATSAEAQGETSRVAMSAETQSETSRVATSAVSPGRKSGETSEKLPRVPAGTTPDWSADLVQLAPVGSTKDMECGPPPLPAGF